MTEKFYCVKCRTKFDSDKVKVKYRKNRGRRVKFHVTKHCCGTESWRIVG